MTEELITDYLKDCNKSSSHYFYSYHTCYIYDYREVIKNGHTYLEVDIRYADVEDETYLAASFDIRILDLIAFVYSKVK